MAQRAESNSHQKNIMKDDESESEFESEFQSSSSSLSAKMNNDDDDDDEVPRSLPLSSSSSSSSSSAISSSSSSSSISSTSSSSCLLLILNNGDSNSDILYQILEYISTNDLYSLGVCGSKFLCDFIFSNPITGGGELIGHQIFKPYGRQYLQNCFYFKHSISVLKERQHKK